MRYLVGLGFCSALLLSAGPGMGADCSFNEAEGLNSKITSRILAAKAGANLTPDLDSELDELRGRFNAASDQHTAAMANDDQNSLNAVCEDYRSLLDDIDTLAKQPE